MRLLPLLLPLLALAGCDLDGKQLLQHYADGELLEPTVVDLDAVDDEALGVQPQGTDADPYVGTVGPSDVGTGRISGSTLTVQGTGDRLCVIVDPQSVFRDDRRLDADGNSVANPFMDDFPADDGDLDLLAGLASYYTGTPGQQVGDFINDFPDENGVDRRIDLNLCLMQDNHGDTGGTAGRATPEWCDFATQAGVDYRIVLQVFSVPIDDDELKYALQVRHGSCPALVDECTLRGDHDDHPGELPGSYDNVEDQYCGALD